MKLITESLGFLHCILENKSLEEYNINVRLYKLFVLIN